MARKRHRGHAAESDQDQLNETGAPQQATTPSRAGAEVGDESEAHALSLEAPEAASVSDSGGAEQSAPSGATTPAANRPQASPPPVASADGRPPTDGRRRAGAWFSGLIGGLVGGAAVALVWMLLAREQPLLPQLVARLDAVDGRIGEVEQRLRAAESLFAQVQRAAAEAAQRDADLGARIDALTERLAGVAETIQRLPTLEQSGAVGEALAPLQEALRAASERAAGLEREFATRWAEVQAALNDLGRVLAERTQQIERQLQQQVTVFDERAKAVLVLPQEVAQLRAELGHALDEWQAQAGRLEQAQSALGGRINALAQDLERLRELRARELGLMLASTEIAAAATDGRPYGEALALLRRVAGDAPELAGVIAALERFADSGIPTIVELSARFEALATGLSEEPKEAPVDLLTETRRNLASLISIRRRDEPPAATEAMIAAARQHLARGDVEAAAQVLLPLAEAGHAAARDWRALVEARRQALDALARLAVFARQHLATATGY